MARTVDGLARGTQRMSAVPVYVTLGFFALGVWLVVRTILAALVDIVSGLGFRLRRHWPEQRLAARARVQQERAALRTASQASTVWAAMRQYPWPWLASVSLAVLLRDPLFSPLVAAFSLAGGLVLYARVRRQRVAALTAHADLLVMQFATRYPLLNSIGQTLAVSGDTLPAGPLKTAVEATTARLDVQVEGAFLPLQQLPQPTIQRFAHLLARFHEAAPEVFTAALESLQADLATQRSLQQRVRRELTLVNGTVNFLQVVAGVSLLGAAWLPAWRIYFTASPSRVVFFMVLTAALVGGTLVTEQQMQQLEQAV